MSDRRTVLCGCTWTGIMGMRALVDAGHSINHIVALTPDQAEAANVSGYQDFRPFAEANGIPVYIPKTYALTDTADRQFFEDEGFDLLLLGGWQRLIPGDVLRTLSIGGIGGHGSPDFLPKGRGRSPLNWSLLEGRKRFVMHIFFMKQDADDGDVIDWDTFDILPFDTIRTLYWKVHLTNVRMLLRSLPSVLDGTVELRPQLGKPSYFDKRGPEDGLIDWEEMDVWQIHDLVRALTKPYPGARADVDGGRHLIWRAQVFDTRITYPAAAYGEVVERFEGNLIVNCRGGLLMIDDYEPMVAGKTSE